jgi:predicted metal-dependent hydrolase
MKSRIHFKSISLQGKTHPYTMRRSRRARHILLHVHGDGQIELVVPWHVAFTTAENFLYQRQPWLIQRLSNTVTKSPLKLENGCLLPLLDQQIRLEVETIPGKARSRCRRYGSNLTIRVADSSKIRASLIRWYRKQAHHHFTIQTQHIARQLNVLVKKIRIGEFSSQWGSCTPTGRLSFSWRLMLAPKEIANYVAIHETIHLLVPNHSPAFWEIVQQYAPEQLKHRVWLKERGPGLQHII